MFLIRDNSTSIKGLGQLDHAHGDHYIRKVHAHARAHTHTHTHTRTHMHMHTVSSTLIITSMYVTPMKINIFTHYII